MSSETTDPFRTGSDFPRTRWSVIRSAGDRSSPDCRESLEVLAGTYWRPVYAYFRRKWGKSDEEAKDLTQDFFAAMVEKDFLEHLSVERGLFRSYVMAALDNFARMRHRQDSRLKRGGGTSTFSLRLEEGFEPASDGSPEGVFQLEWARAVLEAALQDFQGECAGNETAFKILMLRDIESPPGEDLSYEALALRFAVKAADVSNWLTRGRKRLRELILQRLRDTVTSEQEAIDEMLLLFQARGS